MVNTFILISGNNVMNINKISDKTFNSLMEDLETFKNENRFIDNETEEDLKSELSFIADKHFYLMEEENNKKGENKNE